VRRFRYELALCMALVAACSKKETPEIQVLVGTLPDEKQSFVPATALAEYVALPGRENQLRIMLASYPTACERFVAPGRGQVLVNVVVTTPPDQPPVARSYPWPGGTAKNTAMPSAHLDHRSYEFPPGGELQLRRVELDPHGSVEGVLDFSFPGDAEQSAKRLSGAFEARICRYSGPP
jgi:hypothetical protein